MISGVDDSSFVGQAAAKAVGRTRRLGEQTAFYGQALWGTADAVRRYPTMVLRQIAGMGMGTGALAVIGGTVVIVGFLTLSTGALIAVQGYNTLSNVGIEALTGFLGAFLNVRFIAPATAGVALAATIGAGATAQIGAMRINEEIDALEVMGHPAGDVSGLDPHRGRCHRRGPDLHRCRADVFPRNPIRHDDHLRAVARRVRPLLLDVPATDGFLAVVLRRGVAFMAAAVMAVHTYYGYTVTGGPAGVGEAVGRAVRLSITAGVFILLTITLSVYGQSGNFHLSG